MKIIKTLLLLTIVIAVSSCTKGGGDPQRIYAITANIDGSAAAFTDVTGVTGAANGAIVTTIQGKTASGDNISVTINGEIVEGKTYSAAVVGATLQPVVKFTTGADVYVNSTAGANLVSVTVTQATATFIEGTFTGDLATVAVGGGAVKTKVITKGIFTSALKKQ